ncbi:MAG: GNAT family N-acetyltransferase [Pseudomonadales bacterium]|jgi:predicted acetyltransferase
MEISIEPIRSTNRETLADLMQLYLQGLSEFSPVKMDEPGQYIYPYFNHYWQDKNRYPYFIRWRNQLAGFALVRLEIDAVERLDYMEIAEFFVLPRFRGQKVGSQAAITIWKQYTGRWLVNVLDKNKPAYSFWKELIISNTQENFTERFQQSRGGGSQLEESQAIISFRFSS